MTLTIEPEAPPLRADESGTVRVGKTRITLDAVVQAFRDGATPEQIVQDFDTLDLGEVYGTIGYYLRHREEVDAYLAGREREADDLRRKVEAAQAHLPDIRQRLLNRKAAS